MKYTAAAAPSGGGISFTLRFAALIAGRYVRDHDATADQRSTQSVAWIERDAKRSPALDCLGRNFESEEDV